MGHKLALLGVISFSLGVLLAPLCSFSLSFGLFLILLSAGFLCAWFFGKRDWYVFPAIFLMCFSLGGIRVTSVPLQAPSEFASWPGQQTSFEGTIVSDPDVRETKQRLTVLVHERTEETKILVVAERYPVHEVGEMIRVTGTPEVPQPFETDGGRTFSYDTFLAKDGIFLLVPHALIEDTGTSHDVMSTTLRYLFRAKHLFTQGLENALPEPAASLAEGLLVGGKQGLGTALLDAFTIVGLLPLIVLSGYNVMIVAEGVLVSLSFLPKRFAALSAAVVIALFVISAGSGTSALRAGLMALLALYARASGRTYAALRALLFVFMVMLIWNPLLLVHDPGFQFSFVATLGLIVLSSRLELVFTWIRSSALRDVVATTLAAQLFVLPLLLYQTGNLSLFAIPANILVLPIVPLAMLFSCVAGVFGFLLPTIAPIIALPAYLLLTYIVSLAETFARIPFAHLIIPDFSVYVLIPLYTGIGWYTWYLYTKHPTGSHTVSGGEFKKT